MFKVIVVGLGNIGMMYDYEILDKQDKIYTHAKATCYHPDFILSGGVDYDENLRNLFQIKYKKKAYSELNEAITIIKPDLVIIASPTNTHIQIIEKCLKYKFIKHILCEKPLAINHKKCFLIQKKCIKNNVKLFVNYIRRSDKGVIEIKSRIDRKKIMEPIKGFCWYSKGLYNNASHFFNLFEYWLGSFKSGKLINLNHKWFENDPDLDFIAYFEKGSIIFQSGWEEHFSHSYIELLSRSGRLIYENGGKKILWQNIQIDNEFPKYKLLNEESEIIPNSRNIYQFEVMNMISNAMKGKDYFLCDGYEAFKTVESLNKIENQNES